MELNDDPEESLWMHDWLDAVHRDVTSENHMPQFQQYGLHQRNAYGDDSSDEGIQFAKALTGQYSDSSSEEESYGPEDSYNEYEAYSKQDYHTDEEDEDYDDYSDQGSSKPRSLPHWYNKQPFQYNGRILLISIPGIVLVGALSGDMLIFVITIGTLITYLLHGSGSKRQAFISFMITFICAQIVVLYASVPLIWKSLLNIIIIVSVNLFCSLTGAWMMLMFPAFRNKEPDFARSIETVLFTVYPGICTILLTWILISFTSVFMTPYLLLGLGFVILQPFISPCYSSFVKMAEHIPVDDTLILDDILTALITLCYITWPVFVHCFIQLMSGEFTDPYTHIELLFIICVGVFLSTYIGLRVFLDSAGIVQEQVARVRWVCSINIILLLPFILRHHGSQSYLLPWLPACVLLYVGSGYLMKEKKKSTFAFILGIVTVGVYVVVFSHLPWSLQYGVLHIHIRYLFILLFLNAVICLECVFAAVYFTAEEFGLTVLCQTIMYVSLEKLLYHAEFLHFVFMVASSVFIIYTIIKLYQNQKLSWLHSSVIVSLHLACLVTSVDSNVNNFFDALGQFVLFTGLFVALVKYVFVDTSTDVTYDMFIKSMGVSCITSIFAVFSSNMYTYVCPEEPVIGNIVVILLILSGVSSKLTLVHTCEWKHAKYLGPAMIIVAITLAYMQPSIALNWDNVVRWMLVSCLLLTVFVVRFIPRSKSSAFVFILSSAIGFPLGFALGAIELEGNTALPVEICMFYGAHVSMCLMVGMLLWQNAHYTEKHVFTLYILLSSIMFADVLLYLMIGPPRHSLMAPLITSLTLAIMFKLHSLTNMTSELTKDGMIIVSQLPVLGNISTCVAFIITMAISPSKYWEYYMVLSSAILFLLQKDTKLLTNFSRQTHSAPPAISISLFILLAALRNSLFWTTEGGYITFIGVIELLTIMFSLPVLFILFTVMLNIEPPITTRAVVFFTPAFAILLLFSTSYEGWLFAGYGLVVGTWLMCWELRFEIDVDALR